MLRPFLEEVDAAADLVGQLLVYVALDAADQVGRVVDAVARHRLEEVHHGLAVAPRVHEERVETALVGAYPEPEQMAVDPLELRHDDANGLGPRRHFDASELLDRERIGHRVDVGTDSAHPLEHVHALDPVVLLDALLDPTVDVAETDGSLGDDFSVDGYGKVRRFLERRVLRPDGHHELARGGCCLGLHRHLATP